MRVFITGIAGFIGTALSCELVERGVEVTGCDPNLEDGTLVESLKRVDCDVIVHLAALTDAGYPDDAEMWQRNLGASGAACELAYQAGARLVVTSSAAAVHPELSAYAASKSAMERLALTQDATVLRYSNVYGHGGRGVLDRWEAAYNAGEPIRITGDGTQTRDFISVGSVARITAQTVFSDAGDGQIIDVCTGNQARIIDVARSMYPKHPIEFVPRRGNDPDFIEQDPTKMHELLGALV